MLMPDDLPVGPDGPSRIRNASRPLSPFALDHESELAVLDALASGAPLLETLDKIARAIDAASEHRSSILLVSEEGRCLRHAAAPHLPDAFNKAIDGLPIGEGVGVCGTAAHRAAQVIVEDVATDPLCKDFRALADEHGLRACWSTPVLCSRGRVLATLALYGEKPGRPLQQDIELIDRAARLVSIAIERDLESRRAIRIEEQLLRTLESISEALVTMDTNWRFTYMNPEAERVLQRSRDELIGKVVWDEYPQAGGPAFERAYREAVETGKPVEFEEHYPGLDLWFNVRAFPTADGLAVYFNDVTQKRRARELIAASEERLRLLAKATNDAIYDWDLSTDALWWNEGYELLFGYRREEIPPTIASWTAPLHPDDAEAVERSLREALAGSGDHWTSEYRYRRSDGSYAFVLDRGYILRDERGRAVRMIGGMTDLTERKTTELRLAEQAALLDQASDAIIVRDLQNRIRYWNRRAEEVYGWSSGEALGRSVATLLYDDPAPLHAATEAVLKDGGWTGELEHRNKAGEFLTVLCRWTLLRDQHGNPESILAINSDITERKRIEQQFLRAQRMESIGTLASGIAHDLNNVLARILMSIEMLRGEVQSEEALKTLDMMRGSARRGADLIKQVLGFARGIDSRPAVISPVGVVRDIQRIVKDTFPRNIEFYVETVPDLWSVHMDPTQLHQVLMNLCLNARDAMPAGGSITIQLQNVVVDDVFAGMNMHAKPGPYVMLLVADSGTGMTRAVQDKIFEPFFTTKEVGKGTGLGLSTTFTIVKNHGGFINVYSEAGKGSKFKIYLPAVIGAAAMEETAVAQTGLPRGQGELVLLVDDEENVREITRRALERFGYRVMTASNGAEGVSLYFQHRDEIAVVLTDMSMPVMDGPAMIIAIKSIDPKARIIGSSGLAANGDVAKALGAGVEFFVPKPYTSEALLNTLRQVLSGATEGKPVHEVIPASGKVAPAANGAPSPEPSAAAATKLLLVEDNDALRRLAERQLRAAGHEVICAADGMEALEILEREGEKIRLVLTDLNMPHLGGEGLYNETLARHGKRTFIFMSGSSDVSPAIVSPDLEGAYLLPKPFTSAELNEAVRRALDA